MSVHCTRNLDQTIVHYPSLPPPVQNKIKNKSSREKCNKDANDTKTGTRSRRYMPDRIEQSVEAEQKNGGATASLAEMLRGADEGGGRIGIGGRHEEEKEEEKNTSRCRWCRGRGEGGRERER